MSLLIKNLITEKDPLEKKNEKRKDDEQKPRPIIKSATDLQRLKLEKLMKNPEKPIMIPEPRKEKDYMQSVPSFVRNVMGSSAGAGSGEFHVYRHLRRKEYARQKTIQAKSAREQMDEDYQRKIEENQRAAEDKTAKKRAKRLKKKQRSAKRSKNNQSKGQNEAEGNESEIDESENEGSKSNYGDEKTVAEMNVNSQEKAANKNETVNGNDDNLETQEVQGTESEKIKSVVVIEGVQSVENTKNLIGNKIESAGNANHQNLVEAKDNTHSPTESENDQVDTRNAP